MSETPRIKSLTTVRDALYSYRGLVAVYSSGPDSDGSLERDSRKALAALARVEKMLPMLLGAYHRDANHGALVESHPQQWSDCPRCKELLEMTEP